MRPSTSLLNCFGCFNRDAIDTADTVGRADRITRVASSRSTSSRGSCVGTVSDASVDVSYWAERARGGSAGSMAPSEHPLQSRRRAPAERMPADPACSVGSVSSGSVDLAEWTARPRDAGATASLRRHSLTAGMAAQGESLPDRARTYAGHQDVAAARFHGRGGLSMAGLTQAPGPDAWAPMTSDVMSEFSSAGSSLNPVGDRGGQGGPTFQLQRWLDEPIYHGIQYDDRLDLP